MNDRISETGDETGYEASVNVQVGNVKKRQVNSSLNWQACMNALMYVVEAKDVGQDRSRWSDVVSAYVDRKRREVLYCMYIHYHNTQMYT